MKYVQKLAIPAGLALLGGCATTKFAPPVILTESRVIETDTCTMFPADKIQPNTVKGTADLVNNYVYAYRCYTGKLASGRQTFQVPAYLGIAASTAAVALGAGPLVAVAGGSFATVANAGNGYFAPEQKAVIANKALNAVICIQNESVGVPAYAPPAATKAAGDAAAAKSNFTGSVPISWDQQYFTMVKAALLSVEAVVRERLVSAGTYNPSGTIAEIEALQKKRDAAVAAAAANANAKASGEAAPAPVTPIPQDTVVDQAAPAGDVMGPDGKPVSAATPVVKTDAELKAAATAEAAAKARIRADAKTRESELALAEMQPKLALCVERAKI